MVVEKQLFGLFVFCDLLKKMLRMLFCNSHLQHFGFAVASLTDSLVVAFFTCIVVIKVESQPNL